jgi:hypothetical protein
MVNLKALLMFLVYSFFKIYSGKVVYIREQPLKSYGINIRTSDIIEKIFIVKKIKLFIKELRVYKLINIFIFN